MLTFIHLTALTLAASVSTMLTEYTPVKQSLQDAAKMTPTYTIMYHGDAKVTDSDTTDVKADVPDVKSDAKASTDSTKDNTADDIAKDVTSGAIDDVDAKSKDAAKVATDGTVGATDGTDGTDTTEGSDDTDAKEGSDDVNVLRDGTDGDDEAK